MPNIMVEAADARDATIHAWLTTMLGCVPGVEDVIDGIHVKTNYGQHQAIVSFPRTRTFGTFSFQSEKQDPVSRSKKIGRWLMSRRTAEIVTMSRGEEASDPLISRFAAAYWATVGTGDELMRAVLARLPIEIPINGQAHRIRCHPNAEGLEFVGRWWNRGDGLEIAPGPLRIYIKKRTKLLSFDRTRIVVLKPLSPPRTVMQAAIGRPLGDLIALPEIDPQGILIKKCWTSGQEDPRLTIELEDDPIPLSEACQAIDRARLSLAA